MRIRNKNRKYTTIHVERARHKISQKELAKKMKVSRQDIHNTENGKTVPNLKFALKIAHFFNKPVEDLFNNY